MADNVPVTNLRVMTPEEHRAHTGFRHETKLDAIARAIDPGAWEISSAAIGLCPKGMSDADCRKKIFEDHAPRRRRARQAAKRVVAVLAQS